MARSIIIQKVLSYLQPQQQDGFRRGFFWGERKRADLVWGTSVAADSFSKETEKHKNGGKQLISAKDFAELKMKSGKYIELHIIPWPHPSPIFFFSLFNSFFFFFLTYAATGVSQLPRVPFLSAPKSKPVCPHLFSSGQKRKKHKFQPRPCWPTSRQYPFQLNPSFSLPPPPRRRWSLSAEAVKLWGGNTHGEVSAPLCVNAWEVTYLGTERKEKEGGVEYQFRCSLLGQIHLLYGMKKKGKNHEWVMFASFPFFPTPLFFFFFATLHSRRVYGCCQIYSKINTSAWIIFTDPKQRDESTVEEPFPGSSTTSCFTSKLLSASIFFLLFLVKVRTEGLGF